MEFDQIESEQSQQVEDSIVTTDAEEPSEESTEETTNATSAETEE